MSPGQSSCCPSNRAGSIKQGTSAPYPTHLKWPLVTRSFRLATMPPGNHEATLSGPDTLLVVGCNPPTTDGLRTMARADQARRILGYDHCLISNIFGFPTYRSGEIATIGTVEDGWRAARSHLLNVMPTASAILLGYGLTKPPGVAGKLHTQQLVWLEEQIASYSLPVWWVGGSPRHPSRWQRYTHRAFPNLDYPDALAAALTLRPALPSQHE